jgi:hypothetical protein
MPRVRDVHEDVLSRPGNSVLFAIGAVTSPLTAHEAPARNRGISNPRPHPSIHDANRPTLT